MVHALQWHPWRWLDLDILTTTLFGGRLSLYSLLPTAFLTEPYNLAAGGRRLPLGILTGAGQPG